MYPSDGAIKLHAVLRGSGLVCALPIQQCPTTYVNKLEAACLELGIGALEEFVSEMGFNSPEELTERFNHLESNEVVA